VTGIFGGPPEGRRRTDPERGAAAQRQRAAFAADIGDEHARAWAHDPPRRTRRPGKLSWVILAALALFATLGAIPLLRAGEGGLLKPDCTRAAVVVDPDKVAPGQRMGLQAAGPERDGYVLALDTDTLGLSGASVVTQPGGSVLKAEFRMNGCHVPQSVFQAPARPGSHLVTLFRREGGSFTAVAGAPFDVD
jgi:hypothetical protein